MTGPVELAQTNVPSGLIARMIIQFHTEFDGVYGADTMTSSLCAIGPLQAMIGLAIKNGHLSRATHPQSPDAEVAGEVDEAALERALLVQSLRNDRRGVTPSDRHWMRQSLLAAANPNYDAFPNAPGLMDELAKPDCAHPAPAEPAGGWVTVPREPTPEMCAAAVKFEHSPPHMAILKEGYARVYQDMIAAAPQPLTPKTDIPALVERLKRAAKNIEGTASWLYNMDDDQVSYQMADEVIEDQKAVCEAAEAISALSQEVGELSTKADCYEEALQQIDQWSRAYPRSVFPKPDFVKARYALEAAGMTLDAISADNMRHVVEGVGEIARAALRASQDGGEG